jgi:hypothetical protein
MSSQQQQIDLRQVVDRFTRSEQIIAVASIVLLIDMFIGAWLHLSVDCSGIPAQFCVGGGFFASGFNGWGWLTFLALLAVIVFFVVRKFLANSVALPELPLSDAQVYMVLGVVEVIGILLFWVEYHGNGVGFGWAWIVALIAAAATIVGGYLKQGEPQTAAGNVSGSATPSSSYGPPSSGSSGSYGPPPSTPPGAGGPPPTS